jgi:hypothetical protein
MPGDSYPMVVFVYKLCDSKEQGEACLCRIEINVRLLECSEPAFNDSIVGTPSFAIHADCNSQIVQTIYPMRTGIRRPLIGVDHFRFAIDCHGLQKQCCLVLFLHATGYLACPSPVFFRFFLKNHFRLSAERSESTAH